MKRLIILFFFLSSVSIFGQTNDTLSAQTKQQAVESYRKMFFEVLPRPIHWNLVNDYENLYSHSEQKEIESILNKFEVDSAIEIAVVTIDTIKTSNENFEKLSLQMARKWKVGKPEKDNGILIAISKGYRIMRIQNGNGIEKILSDAETKNIIDNYFIPAFKKGDYYLATLHGLNQLITILQSRLKR